MITTIPLTLFLIWAAATASSASPLAPDFYLSSCPSALPTIQAAVRAAVQEEPRMGASLLRLHFHDCFVQGCDGSVLLRDRDNFKGEQTAPPNINSIRGLEVIDTIKSQLEKICPGTVSCADILATAARDSVVALGGLSWPVKLGRRDSTTASLTGAQTDLPGPSLNLSSLVAAFQKKNFTAEEMVALSGAHTIGLARCKVFRQRLYTDANIDRSFARSLQAGCPRVGGDDNLSHIDAATPFTFDNAYYRNLAIKKGLFHSDQELVAGGRTSAKVLQYGADPLVFLTDFAAAMVKMGELGPLTGTQGQIRGVCSRVN